MFKRNIANNADLMMKINSPKISEIIMNNIIIGIYVSN